MTLSDYHKKAKSEKWAIPHFNFATLDQLNAIALAAKEYNAPILVGTSESERKFVGENQAVALVKSLREQGCVIFINADHCHSVESAYAAIDKGYDSVHIDLSSRPFNENIKGSKQVVEYAKNKSQNVEVEAELGYLVTQSSTIYEEEIKIPEESLTKIDDAVKFVQETGIDRFAPAIGNLHGISANKPQIRFDLVEELSDVLSKDLTFVLHGGSGIEEKDLKKLVSLGYNNIHISTELRAAYTKALRKSLEEDKETVTPYKYLEVPQKKVIELVKHKLSVYNAKNVL